MRRAFDLGVTHFDLANNYGPPYGAAETNAGRILARGLRALPRRAGHLLQGGLGHVARPVRRPRLAQVPDGQPRPVAAAARLDYVDIFYHHRPDPETPLEETMGALDAAVRAGKALYVGVSSYSPEHTRRAAAILRDLGTPLLIHQPSYSMFNRWIEGGLLDVLERGGRRLHRVHRAGPGTADQPLPERDPGGLPGRPGQVARRRTRSARCWSGAGAERDRRRAAVRRSPSWPWPGCCGTPG